MISFQIDAIESSLIRPSHAVRKICRIACFIALAFVCVTGGLADAAQGGLEPTQLEIIVRGLGLPAAFLGLIYSVLQIRKAKKDSGSSAKFVAAIVVAVVIVPLVAFALASMSWGFRSSSDGEKFLCLLNGQPVANLGFRCSQKNPIGNWEQCNEAQKTVPPACIAEFEKLELPERFNARMKALLFFF